MRLFRQKRHGIDEAVLARLAGDPAGQAILELLRLAGERPDIVAADPVTNFPYSTVQSGTIIGSSGNPKTIGLFASDGAHFPGGDGVTQFNVVIWPNAARPLAANAEIARVTRSGDTLTTTARAQEGTSALSTVGVGYQVMQAVTKKTLDDRAEPIGSIKMWPGAAAPSADYLLCQGQSLLRTDYPALFVVLSTTYGSVDGTHFTLPDLQGRIVVGLGTNAAVNALALNDGVTLANRRPQHRHTAHGHTATSSGANGLSNMSNNIGSTGDSYAGGQTPNIPSNNPLAAHQLDITTSVGTADGGSGTATDSLNAPAYLVMNYIIHAL